jgi:hypothetical protein
VTYERNDQVLHTSTKKPTLPLLIHTSELLLTWCNGNEREAAHRSINEESSPSAWEYRAAPPYGLSDQDGLIDQKAGALRPSVFSACTSRPQM